MEISKKIRNFALEIRDKLITRADGQRHIKATENMTWYEIWCQEWRGTEKHGSDYYLGGTMDLEEAERMAEDARKPINAADDLTTFDVWIWETGKGRM